MQSHLPVYDLLRDAAEKWPENPAVHDAKGSITFTELFSQTETLRKKLTDLGVKPGMGLGLKARNGRNFIMGLFAGVGCGATVMPVSQQLKKQELEDLLAEAGLHALIDDGSGVPAQLTVTSRIEMETGSFSLAYTGNGQTLPYAPNVDQPAFIRFTSGTTGKSKGVVVSHQSVIERIDGANKALCLGPGDTVVWVLPMAYHFIVSVVLYVRFGAAIAVAEDFLAKNIIEITNRHQCTLLYASPMQIRLLSNDKGADMMPSLKHVISTSASISPDVCLAFQHRFGIPVSQAYGIIEIGLPMINYNKSAEHPEAVGYALPGYTVDILDDDHNPLPPGKTGHLAIKGPGMFDAYLLPATPRDEVLKNGYFLTADYASKSADGLVTIEGRAKSVINVSGLKVFPEEVEAVLELLPEIKMARISSSPHPLMGQVIEGEIVLHEGKSIDVEDVLTYCRKRLSSFKAPQRLRIVDSLPVTGSGKVRRY